MPAFSGPFDWQLGLLWQVGFVADDQAPDQGILHICSALVDTGASQTCISRSIAEQLRLEPSGKVEMRTAGGLVSVNVYDVQFVFILGAKSDSQGNLAQGQGEVLGQIRAPEFDRATIRSKL